MLTLIISSVFGLFHALLPQIITGFGKKFERDHEYRMSELTYKNAKGERELRMNELVENNSSKEYLALIKSAEKKTGIRWVDSLAGMARPTIAFSVLAQHIALGLYIVLDPTIPAFAYNTVWESSTALTGYVITFYFGRREADKWSGKGA